MYTHTCMHPCMQPRYWDACTTVIHYISTYNVYIHIVLLVYMNMYMYPHTNMHACIQPRYWDACTTHCQQPHILHLCTRVYALTHAPSHNTYTHHTNTHTHRCRDGWRLRPTPSLYAHTHKIIYIHTHTHTQVSKRLAPTHIIIYIHTYIHIHAHRCRDGWRLRPGQHLHLRAQLGTQRYLSGLFFNILGD